MSKKVHAVKLISRPGQPGETYQAILVGETPTMIGRPHRGTFTGEGMVKHHVAIPGVMDSFRWVSRYHAILTVEDGQTVWVMPGPGVTPGVSIVVRVNGMVIDDEIELQDGDVVEFGDGRWFVANTVTITPADY